MAFLHLAMPRTLFNSTIISPPRNNSSSILTLTNCVHKFLTPPPPPPPPPSVSALTSFPLLRRRYCTAAAEPAAAVGRYSEEMRSPQLVALEYADLNLSDKFCEEVGHVRIRQHVNPLRSSLMIPAEIPDWNKVFKDATLPLMVDIGSGSGRFLLWLAKGNPYSRNYLGMEIRQKLAKRAQYWVDELALTNIHFIFANALVSFKQLVSTYPGPLAFVSILCPDPHFKKKHHKRRVVQKPLVESVVDCLMPGGQIFIQSDVFEVAVDMRNCFDAKMDKLVRIDIIDPNVPCDKEGWLLKNPMGIRTEREIHAEFEGARIYRRIYQKRLGRSAHRYHLQNAELMFSSYQNRSPFLGFQRQAMLI